MNRRIDDIPTSLIVIVFILAAIIGLSGCQSTGVYDGAKTANDASFNAAILRVCDPLSYLPAQRNLSEDALAARQLLCESISSLNNK